MKARQTRSKIFHKRALAFPNEPYKVTIIGADYLTKD
jgi:hypothetical protein